MIGSQYQPSYYPPVQAGLGEIDLSSLAIGGSGFVTGAIVLGATFFLWEMFGSSRASEKKQALTRARQEYTDRVREIKGKYSRRGFYKGGSDD